MEHRVGETVPVIFAVPARRRQQALTFTTVREAASDLPANVRGIGEDHVQGDRTDLAAGIERLLDVGCTGQIKERIQALVVLEVGHLQRQAQAIAGRRCAGIEQCAMTRLVDRFTNRAAAFDQKGFLVRGCRHPLAIRHVRDAVAFALDLLKEQILIVALDVAHAPRQLAVEAAEDQWQTGDGRPGHLIFRCTDLHEAPGRVQPGGQLHVAGQQAFATTAALWRDRPIA